MKLFADDYLQIRDLKIFNYKVLKDLKIAALSDLHISKLVGKSKLDPLKYQLYEENADYNVFLGDLFDSPLIINNHTKQKELLGLLQASANIAPTMIILGSHDYVDETKDGNYLCYNEEFWNRVANIKGITLLNNSVYKDDKIFFMGYMQTLKYYYSTNPDYKHHEDSEAFYEDFRKQKDLYQRLPSDLPKIALIHSLEFTDLEKNQNLLNEYDLVMGGHDHDGCVPFGIGNFKRGIISPKKEILPENVRGFRTLENGTHVLVNGGIVKIQDCAPNILHPFNHLCPMQMDTITLTPNYDEVEINKRLIYTKK